VCSSQLDPDDVTEYVPVQAEKFRQRLEFTKCLSQGEEQDDHGNQYGAPPLVCGVETDK
jgi:hypothetical protein